MNELAVCVRVCVECLHAQAQCVLSGGGARQGSGPAMKETVGFLTLLFMRTSAASSSEEPPISPMSTMPSVSGSLRKNSTQSLWLVPLKGSPPMPMHVDCPSPRRVVWYTASYVSVPDRDTMPILPATQHTTSSSELRQNAPLQCPASPHKSNHTNNMMCGGGRGVSCASRRDFRPPPSGWAV